MGYPEDQACITESHEGFTISLIIHSTLNHYCGYCRFPKRPVKERAYRGILTYVPVHGGLTYAKEDDEGMIYGFDCAHLGDETNPNLMCTDFLKSECVRMAKAIQIAASLEDEYLAADGNEATAAVLDAFHKLCADEVGLDFDPANNIGAMINLLGGSL